MKIIAYGIREDERPYVENWQWANPDVELVCTGKLLGLNWPGAAMAWLPTSRKATRLIF